MADGKEDVDIGRWRGGCVSTRHGDIEMGGWVARKFCSCGERRSGEADGSCGRFTIVVLETVKYHHFC